MGRAVRGPSAVILVEGVSDQRALEALAERRGRRLTDEGILIVSIGGSSNIGRSLDRFGPGGLGLRVAGLCDVGEEGDFRRALQHSGLGPGASRDGMERLGFYVCVVDLEDELIRALGVDAVETVLDGGGDLGPFRTFQKQPEWRGRAEAEHLRRFIGSGSGRKIRTAPRLVRALELHRVPGPLDAVLAHV